MHDIPAATVKDRAQVVKRATDIEVGDVDMPMLMRLERLDEAGSFSISLCRPSVKQSGLFECIGSA